MDRRSFLSTLIGGVAATAAVRTFPFRVFSFPKNIQLVKREIGVDWGFDSPTFCIREVWRNAIGSDRAYFIGDFVLNKDGIYEPLGHYYRKINEEMIILPPEANFKSSGTTF